MQRRERAPSLAGARIARAVRRQAAPFLLITAVFIAAGLLFDASGGVPISRDSLLWFALAGGLALAAVAFRELGRNTVTSIASLNRHRGYSILGAAPEITPTHLRQLPPDVRSPAGVVTFQPASPFAAAFRDLQEGLAHDQVVAFIAPTPEVGATTAALCAALSAAQQGRRVIAVDCDIRRRSLTRALGRTPSVGVMEAAERPEAWRSFLDHEEESGLPFLPASNETNPWRTLFGSPGFGPLLDQLRAEYDLIVLDCPPATRAESIMLARMADRCVIVAQWDETPLDALRRLTRALRQRSRATTGVYVNRVPPHYRFGRVRPD